MRIIRSNYHDSKNDEFDMYIIREDEENYYVQLTEEYRDKFQEKDKITPLRKCLVGKDKLYNLIEIENIQMNLFYL